MTDLNNEGDFKGRSEKPANILVSRFRSKDTWPIRRLFSYMARRGVKLESLLPFECFREAAIQRYIAFEDRRLRLLNVRRKQVSTRLSKTKF